MSGGRRVVRRRLRATLCSQRRARCPPPPKMNSFTTHLHPRFGNKLLENRVGWYDTPRQWEGGGGTRLLLALVIWPLTTHPFRDGPPFLLLILDTSNIWALVEIGGFWSCRLRGITRVLRAP